MICRKILVCLLCPSLLQAAVQLPPPPDAHHIKDAQLITFIKTVTEEDIDSHLDWINGLSKTYEDVIIRHVFRLTFQGYSASLAPDILEMITHRPEIATIHYVGTAPSIQFTSVLAMEPTIAELSRHDASLASRDVRAKKNRGWNARRITNRAFVKGYGDGPFVQGRNLGKGVTVFVLDTGINATNPGFQGTPTSFGANFVGIRSLVKSSDADLNGHGTMCAGVIGGVRFGLAPQAKLVAVKVATDKGHAACDDVVAGFEYVLRQPGQNNMKVINLSLYDFKGLPDVQQAAQRVIAQGIHLVSSAGNKGHNACYAQPNAARGIISVGSVNAFNKIPIKNTFEHGYKEKHSSNLGPCVTVFAPGSRVTTLSSRSVHPTQMWGTSIAAPQVAAMIANRLSAVGPQTPAQIKLWLQQTATKDQIEGEIGHSRNLILYNDAGA